MAVSPSVINIGPGQTDIEGFVNQAFYGVRQNIQTGAVTIDRIVGDAPISLPDEFTVRVDDYKNWIWSYNSFKFYWGDNGRLLMEVL